MPQHSLKALLQDPAAPAADTLRRAWRLHRLTGLIRRCLPPEARRHCLGAYVSNQTLVLVADSPAWATSLRYQSAAILRHLARHSDKGQLRACRVEIGTADHASPTAPSGPRPRLSRDNAAIVARQADATDHPGLKRALRRLSRRAADS